MLEEIKKLKKEIEDFLIISNEDLEVFNKNFLSRKGVISDLFSSVTSKSSEEKKILGKEINDIKILAQNKLNDFNALLLSKSNIYDSQKVDITLPVDFKLGGGHPIFKTMEKVIKILTSMGFAVIDDSNISEIEDDWHNFSALNIPEDHPARDMQDTFYVNNLLSLRSQASTAQIHAMEERELPFKILSCGKCYRKEDISSRSHCFFHQVEALYIDKDVSLVDLKNHISLFVKNLFGENREIRLRASYFPFTETSAEVDMSCVCDKKGCRLCKYSGWVEIGGAGMTDPKVLENCNIDPEIYLGFAWGFGIERIAMLLYNVTDIRFFSENDIRFLKQFRTFSS